MSKTLLIFRHELSKTVTATWFIIMAVALPLVALLAIEILGYIQNAASGEVRQEVRVGYVDQVGGFDGFTRQGRFVLTQLSSVDEAAQALNRRGIEEYFVIAPDYASTGTLERFVPQRQIAAPEDVTAAIRSFLIANLLADKLPPAEIAWISSPLYLVTTTVTEDGAVATDQGGVGTLILPVAFGVLLVFSLMFASAQMTSSLGEEKENRLMEILLSSVSTRQLLVGKVLGLSVAGLVQVVVWAISTPILLNTASSVIGGIFNTLRLPTGFLTLAVVYFILAYVLFSALMASIGAISSTTSEGQQLSSIITLPVLLPLWVGSLLIMFPDNPISIALTLLPITSPVVVMVRIGAADIPTWQLATSIALLSLSTVGGLVLAARLFRIYLLSYGTRPRLGEVIRSLRG